MVEKTYATQGSDLEGKTIAEFNEGYEDTEIICEDGTTYSIYTYSGNPRDI